MMRYRHEYKYMIDACQEAVLLTRCAGLLQRDPHVGRDGTYLIRSVYLDDLSESCLWDNLRGTDPRSKFRIRYYGSDTGRISLEKKSKLRGMTLKEACLLDREECEALLAGNIPTLTEGMSDTKKRLFTEILLRNLKPRCIVTYDRVPFVYAGGNVRITFDGKLTSSEETDRFLTGRYAQRPVLQRGCSVLEVKWDEVLPLHIKETLCIDHLQWTAFSKYYMCRMLHL